MTLLQFFAMSINKDKPITLESAGLFKPDFSHGQFNFACSRVAWGVVAERSSLPDSSSGVSSRMWVRIPVVTLVSLSKTLNHNCFVLRMGRKAVGPVCCVMHVKEPRTLIVKEKGLAPVFLEWQLNAPKLFAPRNRFL